MVVESLFILCPLFLWVGLMGGASYVNVIHQILEMKAIEKSEKEMAISLSLLWNDIGILGASIFSLWVGNSIFNIEVPADCYTRDSNIG